MALEMRQILDDEVQAFRAAVAMGFGYDSKPEDADRFRSLMPLDRTIAAFEGDQVVATLGDFELQLTVPGGAQLAMAGTTMVTVRPTHRRQGLLRTMMKRHLDMAVERGEPLAGLWASEPAIYGRFGFGLATETHDITIDARRTSVPGPAAELRAEMVPLARLDELVAPFWAEVATERSGFLARMPARWADMASDFDAGREGSALRAVVIWRDDRVVGYLSYRQSPKWDDGVPNGKVTLSELVGVNAQAEQALWHYATTVDLFPNVYLWNGAVDDLVTLEASDSRSIRRLVTDALFVRVLDLPTALAARTFEVDDELVMQVNDDLGYAHGTWLLRVVNGMAEVEATSQPADVTLDVRELGALYLGRACAGELVRSGRVVGDSSAMARLGRLFVTSRAPWCPEMF